MQCTSEVFQYVIVWLVSWVCKMNEQYDAEGQDDFVLGMWQRGQPIDSELKDSGWAHPKKKKKLCHCHEIIR